MSGRRKQIKLISRANEERKLNPASGNECCYLKMFHVKHFYFAALYDIIRLNIFLCGVMI